MGGSTSGLIILILKGETEEKKVMGPKQTLAPQIQFGGDFGPGVLLSDTVQRLVAQPAL